MRVVVVVVNVHCSFLYAGERGSSFLFRSGWKIFFFFLLLIVGRVNESDLRLLFWLCLRQCAEQQTLVCSRKRQRERKNLMHIVVRCLRLTPECVWYDEVRTIELEEWLNEVWEMKLSPNILQTCGTKGHSTQRQRIIEWRKPSSVSLLLDSTNLVLLGKTHIQGTAVCEHRFFLLLRRSLLSSLPCRPVNPNKRSLGICRRDEKEKCSRMNPNDVPLLIFVVICFLLYVCVRARVCRWWFLALSCLLKHPQPSFHSSTAMREDGVDHLAMLSRLFIWLLRVECESSEACSCCLPSLSLSLSLSPSSSLLLVLSLATYHSFARSRSDNKNRPFYAGWSNYIYIYVPVCISPLPFLFSWWPAQFVCVCVSACSGWAGHPTRERERERERGWTYRQNWFIIIEQNRHTRIHTSFYSFLNILSKCPIVNRQWTLFSSRKQSNSGSSSSQKRCITIIWTIW